MQIEKTKETYAFRREKYYRIPKNRRITIHSADDGVDIIFAPNKNARFEFIAIEFNKNQFDYDQASEIYASLRFEIVNKYQNWDKKFPRFIDVKPAGHLGCLVVMPRNAEKVASGREQIEFEAKCDQLFDTLTEGLEEHPETYIVGESIKEYFEKFMAEKPRSADEIFAELEYLDEVYDDEGIFDDMLVPDISAETISKVFVEFYSFLNEACGLNDNFREAVERMEASIEAPWGEVFHPFDLTAFAEYIYDQEQKRIVSQEFDNIPDEIREHFIACYTQFLEQNEVIQAYAIYHEPAD